MVHRAPDSRLLANLIASEKEYVKHLAGFLPLSHAALASLSAYAAASPAHPSSPAQTIAAVIDVLAGADDALQRYTQALDAWRARLSALKSFEDDLTAVLRDRDILVTRLIKASKSTRDAHRSSRLITPLSGQGSASLSSLPSSNSTSLGISGGPASTNAKLAQAQAELQACEAHLVVKERELDARRISVAREGLGARCRALIDCGWVWGEMGKQGLKALQALGASSDMGSGGHTASAKTQPITYSSDNSSLTPSQSASQTATHSAISHDHSTSMIQAPLVIGSKSPTTLPPAHVISNLALPIGARASTPQNNNTSAPQHSTSSDPTYPSLALAPRPKRTKRTRRPPSHHIVEVSDEDSDGPCTSSNPNANVNANANATPVVPRAPFPTTLPDSEAHDNESSSEDASPIGPFEVVENDPFEVIRRTMLSPSASALFGAPAPTSIRSAVPGVRGAHASAPDVRVGTETSPLPTSFPASGSGTLPTTKRERRTSMAFFGSLRGLFRKPKERERVGTDWDEGSQSPSSPTPSNWLRTRANERDGGWVTRTDTRIKASKVGRREDDSDEAPTDGRGRGRDKDKDKGRVATTATISPLVRANSGARLRKGRPGAPTRGTQENAYSPNGLGAASYRAGISMDGWATDGPADVGVGANKSAGKVGKADVNLGMVLGKPRTRRGTMRRRKTSVADLRGSDEGHSDGDVTSSQAVIIIGRSKPSEGTMSGSMSGLRRDVGVDVEEEKAKAKATKEGRSRIRKTSTSKDASVVDGKPAADSKAKSNADSAAPGGQPRRTATTTTTSNWKPSSDGPRHRRSASLSLAGARATLPSQPRSQASSPSSSLSTSLIQSSSQTQAQNESQAKQNARRTLANGHAPHAHKHQRASEQNPSLMSIVANVTRHDESGDHEGEGDKPRTLDEACTPREAELDREPLGAEKATTLGDRGHAKSSSSPTGIAGGQARGEPRAIKMPLRSALRNASRTPSPSPASTSVSTPTASAPLALRVVLAGNKRDRRDVKGATQVEDEDRGAEMSPMRDTASISSYETGRESFYVEERDGVPTPSPSPPLISPPRSQSQSPPLHSESHTPEPAPKTRPAPSRSFSFTFPPPPVDPPPVVPVPIQSETQASANVTEQPSSSNVSTEAPPVRRKSVRVSLQPTFSPTPPAMCDEDGESCAPWTEPFSTRDEGGRQKKKEGKREREGPKAKMDSRGIASSDMQEDMWVDSSEEDEAYSRARRLLSLVGKHDSKTRESKGKGRAS